MGKRGLTILISFILLALFPSLATAELSIKTDQSIYNIGNSLKTFASVSYHENFEGLFGLTMQCKYTKLSYFLTPISLESNFMTAVNVPDLSASASMLGGCTILGELMTDKKLVIDRKESDSFNVTNSLMLIPLKNNMTALPGDTIRVLGVVEEAFGNSALKSSVNLKLEEKTFTAKTEDGRFNFTLDVPKNIKSGFHRIELTASDSRNNVGGHSVELDVIPSPNYIRLDSGSYETPPGYPVGFTASLYDQADDVFNTSISLELNSPSGKNIFRKTVNSNEKINYEFSQYAEPGDYVLQASYKKLSERIKIKITTVKEIRIRYDNETVLVENVGNVPYEDELTFVLENSVDKFPLKKKISLEPSRISSLDLSKEVPFGTYDIRKPIKESIDKIKVKLNSTLEGAVGLDKDSGGISIPNQDGIIASNVTIHDNRELHKRMMGKLSSISGALVGADGVLTKNTYIAPMIVIAIIVLLVVRYGRKPVMRLINGKKDNGGTDKKN